MRAELDRQRLLKREERGKTWVTTRPVLAEERRMIGGAAAGKGTCTPLATDEVAFQDQELDPEQRAAVELPLRSADTVVIIRGVAGTGKTRSTTELVYQLRDRGKPVVLVAPTVRAVDVLKEDGFADAATLARLLIDEKLQTRPRGGFILLDEAALVGTRSMNELFQVAKDAHARVMLLGPANKGGVPLGAVFNAHPIGRRPPFCG